MTQPLLRSGRFRAAVVLLVAALASAWLIPRPVIWQAPPAEDAILHRMEILPGTLSASSRFVIDAPVPSLYITAKPHAAKVDLQLVIYQGETILLNQTIASDLYYECCDGVEPGIYYTAMSQPKTGQGGLVVIASEKPRTISGFDVWLLVFFVVTSGLAFRVFTGLVKKRLKPRMLVLSTL